MRRRLDRLRRALRITRHRPDPERDVREEIDFYLEMREAELRQAGVPAEEARRRAREAFGDRQRVQDECRRLARSVARRRAWTDRCSDLVRDQRLAARSLAHRPVLAATAVLILALGVTVSLAVTGAVRTILLAPLPFAEPDRLVTVYNSYPEAGVPRAQTSVPDYYNRRELPVFAAVAQYVTRTHGIGETGAGSRAFSMLVTPSFFSVLGVPPLHGRSLTEADGEPGAEPVVVLGHELWRRELGGDPSVVGTDLRVDGLPHRVVGVMPAGFRWPTWEAGIWLPLQFTPADRAPERLHASSVAMLARLAPEATVETARERVEAQNAAIMASLAPGQRREIRDTGFHTRVVGFHDDLVRGVDGWLRLLAAGAATVLLVVVVNLVGLLLVHAMGRSTEMRTRHALGASAGRVARVFGLEGALLGAVAGALGLLAARFALSFATAFEAYEIPRIETVRLGAPLGAAGLLAAVGLGAAAGLVAAAAVWRGAGDRGTAARAFTAAPALGRLRGAMVAGQLGMAYVLVTAAGLLAASFLNVMSTDPGLRPEGVLATAVDWPSGAPAAASVDEVLETIDAVPAVTGVAMASQLPFSGMDNRGLLFPEGRPLPEGESVVSHQRTVISDDYFRVLEVPVLAGRAFAPQDDADAPPAVIVDEVLARRYWPGSDPVGRRVRLESADADVVHTVVGVVGEVVHQDLTETAPVGAYYLSRRQANMSFTRMVVRTPGDPYALMPDLRAALERLDPTLGLFWTQSMEDAIAETLVDRRVPLAALTGCALLGLLLAALGAYGTFALWVASRRREIGVRKALGAAAGSVCALVVRQVLLTCAVGLALGVAGAVVLGAALEGFLYGVATLEPPVLAGAALVLLVAAALASLPPTLRALRVDPATSLREG